MAGGGGRGRGVLRWGEAEETTMGRPEPELSHTIRENHKLEGLPPKCHRTLIFTFDIMI